MRLNEAMRWHRRLKTTQFDGKSDKDVCLNINVLAHLYLTISYVYFIINSAASHKLYYPFFWLGSIHLIIKPPDLGNRHEKILFTPTPRRAPYVWDESRLFKKKSSKTVGKHRMVWVECKLFKEKSSKTGLKHRGCIWRIGQLSCYRPRGNRYSHTCAYAFLESFSLKSLYSAQTYGAWLTWVRKVVGNCKVIVSSQPPLSIIHLWSKIVYMF